MFWKRILVSFPALLGLPVQAVLAQTPGPTVTLQEISGVTTIGGFYDLLCNATNWMFAFIMVIAIIMILLGAVKFFTAGGNEEAVATARKYLTYALVGVAVAILARSLVLVVANFLGSSGGLFDC